MMPVLALAATPRTARRAVPFLSVLGLGAEIVSWHHVGAAAPPTAVLATTTAVLPGLPDVPTAVWVDDQASFHTAVSRDVEVALSCHQWLVDHGAVHVPRAGIEVGHWPFLGPVDRATERDRLGLPESLVVAVDHPVATDDIVAILAVASAAVVTGPLVPLALALGTPVVTSSETALRLGLHAGLEVEVAAGRRSADRAARELAADDDRCADRSRRGRRFAEHHLDLARPAGVVRERLGLGAALAGSHGRAAPRVIEADREADFGLGAETVAASAPVVDLDAIADIDLTASAEPLFASVAAGGRAPSTRRFTPRTLRARP